MEQTNEEKKYCVYRHVFPNGKCYIGQTKQLLKRRWQNGNGYLVKNKNGEYTQPLMARAINKYGWESVQHEILFDNLTNQEADRIEKICIILFRSNNVLYGYNLRDGGSNSPISDETKRKLSKIRKENFVGENNPFFGRHHSEETKKRLSDLNSGRKMTAETKEKIRTSHTGYKNWCATAIYCVELNIIFLTIKEASQHFDIDLSQIAKCCKGKAKTAGGYHWRYATQDEIIVEKQRRGIEVA